MSMHSMKDFDPARPARVHDCLNDQTFDWETRWSYLWELYAGPMPDGTVSFYGLILDGWEPV